MPPCEGALYTLLLWSTDVFRSHGDDAAALLWWSGSAVVLVGARHARFAHDRVFAIVAAPLAVAVVAFALIPFQVGVGAMLNVRLAPILLGFALLPFRPRRTRISRAALGAAGAATITVATVACVELRDCVDHEPADVDAVLAEVRPGSRLLSLRFDLSSSTSTSRRGSTSPATTGRAVTGLPRRPSPSCRTGPSATARTARRPRRSASVPALVAGFTRRRSRRALNGRRASLCAPRGNLRGLRCPWPPTLVGSVASRRNANGA